MDKKQYVLLLVAAVVAGLVGGVGSSLLLMDRLLVAQKTPEQAVEKQPLQTAKVIRAERFEVVDAKGNVQARFGGGMWDNTEHWVGLYVMNEGTNKLGFILGVWGWSVLDQQERELVSLVAYEGGSHLFFGDRFGSLNNNPGPTLDVGFLLGGHPGMEIKNGGTVIDLQTGYEGRGMLDMPAGENEASLDVTPEDALRGAASLTLKAKDFSDHREHVADLWAINKVGPSVSLSSGAIIMDDDKKEVIYKKFHERPGIDLGIDADGPRVELKDNNGKTRATLEQTNLEYSTGTIEKRPASSLVLFDKTGHLTWQTP